MSEKENTHRRRRRSPEKKIESALEAGFAEVRTDKDADRTLEKLEREAGGLTEREIAQSTEPKSVGESAVKIEEVAQIAPEPEKAAAVISETARAIAREPINKEADPIDEGILEAGRAGNLRPAVQRGRRLLRKQLFRRLRPLQAIDAIAFVQINDLPHPPALDRAVSRFSWVMTGGHAWALVIILGALADREYGKRTAVRVLPALWLTTLTVEQGIKRFFRRRRPFISLVRSIVVGRKPGSFSFPSGHAAAAFAGSTLLAIYYPGGAKCFRLIAGLVAFSRVYLGAHYPGDVISGGLAGATLARIYHRLLPELFGRKCSTCQHKLE